MMRLHRIAALAACAITLAYPSLAQTIKSGHVLGNGTSAERTPTDTPLFNVMGQSGSGMTISGNTAAFTTRDGSVTNGHCVQWDSALGLIDAGGSCTVGGGGGTVNAATAGQIAYYPTSTNAVSGKNLSALLGYYPLTGAACDGSTDDTTAIQNSWNAAAALGQNLYIGGIGTGVCKFSTLTAPTPTAGETGNRSAIVGAGKGATELLSTSTSTCAITISATYGVNSDYNMKFGGFTLVGANATNTKGICLVGITDINFGDIWFNTWQYGVYAVDSIRVSFQDCSWESVVFGVDGVYGSYSHPNDWTFINPRIAFATGYGIILENPAQLNIVGGDYENNGIGNSTAAVIYVYGNPIEGTAGINISGGYYSDNNGLADVVIDNVSGSQNGVHTINGAEFDRGSSTQFVSSNIYIGNSGTGTTTLNINGNGFQGFNSYVPSSIRPYIGLSSPLSGNFAISSGGNWFQSAVETPAGAWWNETGWVTYNPTLSCVSGTLTSASAVGKYKRIAAKTVVADLIATITTIGSCATAIVVTLPTTANNYDVGTFRNSSSNASGSLMTFAGTGTANMISASGSLPAASGNNLYGTVTYESQN